MAGSTFASGGSILLLRCQAVDPAEIRKQDKHSRLRLDMNMCDLSVACDQHGTNSLPFKSSLPGLVTFHVGNML